MHHLRSMCFRKKMEGIPDTKKTRKKHQVIHFRGKPNEWIERQLTGLPLQECLVGSGVVVLVSTLTTDTVNFHSPQIFHNIFFIWKFSFFLQTHKKPFFTRKTTESYFSTIFFRGLFNVQRSVREYFRSCFGESCEERTTLWEHANVNSIAVIRIGSVGNVTQESFYCSLWSCLKVWREFSLLEGWTVLWNECLDSCELGFLLD